MVSFQRGLFCRCIVTCVSSVVLLVGCGSGGSGSSSSGNSGGSGSGGSGSQVVTAVHAPLRTRYLRTNSYYDGLEKPPPHLSVYDQAHRQFFVSNPFMNEIDVFDAVQETQKATINVPLAWGIDISPIDGSLWAGTLLGDVYHINTSTLKIIQRYPANTIGNGGYGGATALVLADGRLALQGPPRGIGGVDGNGPAIVWDPATNAVDTGNPTWGSVCPYTNGDFALDGTRTLILVASITDTGGVCSYDAAARVETDATLPGSPFIWQIVPTPDGKKMFVTTNLNGIYVLDPKTLQTIGQIPPPTSQGPSVMSLDGKTIYVGFTLFGYDTTTYQHVSTVPYPYINDSAGSGGLNAGAMDETGMIVGPMGHGVGFADASGAGDLAEAESGALAYVTPGSGPVSGGTAITTSGNPIASTMSKFYVGNALVSGAQMTGGQVDATVPPASSNAAVDLTALFTDGTVEIGPEAYSYGPNILEVVTNAATADGGQQGTVVGYGFGKSASAIQVTVGGQPATVQSLNPDPPLSPYPFMVETLTFTIPPGVPGPTKITITSPSGSTSGTFTYTPKSVSYPVARTLEEGIYDPHRNVYFFTDGAQIQVLSTSSGSWQTPISLPATTSTTQLMGIAESPDGSLMAVADYGSQAIYVLNPDDPGTATRYAVPTPIGYPYPFGPMGLVVLDNGSVYFTGGNLNSDFTIQKLDTGTGTFMDLGTGFGKDGSVLLSPDQSRVYSNIGGQVFSIDTATDTAHSVSAVSVNAGAIIDSAISGDGSTISVNGYLTDSSLNPETTPAYIDWETWLPTATQGRKLSQDGSILYQPLTDGVDMTERNTGRLLYRVKVPGKVANVFDSMFLGASNGTLGFLTTTGVTFVDLSSLSIPSSGSQPFPAANSEERTLNTSVEAAKPGVQPWLPSRRPVLRRIGDLRPGVRH